MEKKVIKIDRDACIGCGICANTCQQSAIGMVDGKAAVVRENACDGIGNCLPVCPVDAISFSDVDVKTTQISEGEKKATCPSANVKVIKREEAKEEHVAKCDSALSQWPVQIKLVLEDAKFFDNADLLIAADCSAFSYGNFHRDFMQGKITLIGCPKLDEVDYSEKLTTIIAENNIKSVTVVRMEVPCCGGIENAVKTAVKKAVLDKDKLIPWQVVTISTDGKII